MLPVPDIVTYNALHLGDNLVHLHFLRRMAEAHPGLVFRHAAPVQYRWQLEPLIEGLPNLSLCDLDQAGAGTNAWRGAGGWFYGHPQRNDFVRVHLDWFDHLAKQWGLKSPLRQPRDFLFNYPALRIPASSGSSTSFTSSKSPPPLRDFLVINSPPLSGQFNGFSLEAFDRLILALCDAGHNVITTHPSVVDDVPCTQAQSMDVTAIGRLSQRCRAIIAVATGPIWPTFNVWNTATPRVILNDHERVDILPEVTSHCSSIGQVHEILSAHGLL